MFPEVEMMLKPKDTLSQKPWAFSMLIVKCRNLSPYRMKKFILKDEWYLHFTINNEKAHGFWDSVSFGFYTV
jgi:hypothetical protein